MPSPEYDLGYFAAGVEILEKYILSGDLFWPIGSKPPGSEPPYPQLTLGGLMLSQARLRSRSQSSHFYSKYSSLEVQYNAVRARWRVAWESKATSEFHARLVLWLNFLEDFRSNPENNVDRYAYEVSRRVMLELLTSDASQIPQQEMELLERLDKYLRTVFTPNGFVWDVDLVKGFPPDIYWYLYGGLSTVGQVSKLF